MSKVIVMDHPFIQHKIGMDTKSRYRFKGFQNTDQRDCNADVL